MTDSPLAPDYAAARARFLVVADDARVEPVSSHAHPERGPDGGELAADVIRLGPTDARSTILLASGTHGVEGFAGSALQSRWLERHGRDPLPEGVSIVVLHGVNPYGFAWVRRVDHDNIDANRNVVDFGALPANPDYEELHDLLAPAAWTDEVQERTAAGLVAWGKEHGFDRLQAAATGGQYTHPDGLWFGGTGPGWSHRTLRTVVSSHLAGADRVAVLDLHTGLGGYGALELIVSEPPGSVAYRRSVDWWGERVASSESGESNSSPLLGEWHAAVADWLPTAEVTSTTPEWGTVDGVEVLQALRADNWLHNHGDPTGPDAVAIRTGLRKAFAPDDADWFETVWSGFDETMARTLAALEE